MGECTGVGLWALGSRIGRAVGATEKLPVFRALFGGCRTKALFDQRGLRGAKVRSLGAGHGGNCNSLVKSHQSRVMISGKCQQIQVCYLARTVDSLRRECFSVTQRNSIGPEFMVGLSGELTKPGNQVTWREPRDLAVAGMGHDANHPIFREGTTGPAAFPIGCPPCMRAFVKSMVGIEQRDNHIHVQQAAHRSNPFLIPQIFNAFERYHFAAGCQQRHATAYA